MARATIADLLDAGVSTRRFLSRVRAQRMRRSLAEFVKGAFAARYPSKKLHWNWHHEVICEYLERCTRGEILRLLINVPPRNLKSFIVSVCWPAWWWIHEPAKQFLAVSADTDVVFRDADALRDLCASEWYQKAFRPEWSFKVSAGSRQQDAKGYYRNTAGGHRISKAIGAKAQGIDADVEIFDDILDANDAYNDKAPLKGHIVSVRQTFMTRLNDPATGVIVSVMQRLHQLDFTGVMLEDGGWVHLCFPAEYDGVARYTDLGQYDVRTEKGELLDPVRMPREFLDTRERDLGPRGYAGQYQQLPAAAKGAIINKGWLDNYWTPDTLPKMDYLISSWDLTTGSTKQDADYVVGQVWGAYGEHRYLLDQLRAKLTVDEMLDAVRLLSSMWDTRHTVIEEAAAGKDVSDTLERELYGVERFKVKDRSKEQRLSATVLLWREGLIHLPHYAKCSTIDRDYSWVKDHYIHELVTFPGSAHDDQVDATSQALLWMRDNGPSRIQDSVCVL